jgi:2-(1,2-epoxy-1,2-dihydrophenyl)acetyl-CoA isomerase
MLIFGRKHPQRRSHRGAELTYDHILTERRGDVLIVTLNRPDRLNAAPPAMFVELGEAISRLDGARCVLLTGKGRGFCSGAEVGGSSLTGLDAAEATYQALTNCYNPTMNALSVLAVPVISAVRGPAAGIGCSLALAADMCIASTTGYFLQAFVNIGLIPDGGASFMLARLIGKARATEMMMLGERVPAAKALDWGMIYRVVEDDALDDEAFALAERLAAGPTVALATTRRQLIDSFEGNLAQAMAREAVNQKATRLTEDSSEGGIAFIQKRRPNFKGS